jgi:hypothetical protein
LSIAQLWRLAGAACAALLLLPAGLAQPAAELVPLPNLSTQPVEMRVAYLVNRRLPRMDQVQLQALLASTQRAVREHFGVEVRFSGPRDVFIEDAFAAIPDAVRRRLMRGVFDFKSGRGDRRRLGVAFARGFKEGGESLPDMIDFALPHAPSLTKQSSLEEFGAAMAELHLRRLDEWRMLKALDGGPAIDAGEFNEFMMWIALGYSDLPYELVLTNQVIASVEYVLPAVHASVRGGYTNGITTYNKQSRLGTMAIWSTFAFTGNDEFLLRWRDGERYDAIEAAQLAGLAATHEVGHQLFHFQHPFSRPACLMSPVPMFAYRAWARKLSARDCAIGSDAAMTPGANKFYR